MSVSRKATGLNRIVKAPIAGEIRRVHAPNAAHSAGQAALAAIVEYSDDAILSSTLDGIVRTWNRGAQHIFGYTAAEIIGQPNNRMIPPDRQDEEPRILALLKAEKRAEHFETTRITKSGRNVDVAVTISPIKDAGGHLIAFSNSTRNITSQKQAQRELQVAKENAEAASNAKDHFLSVLSHELRTPLTPVLAEISYLETQLGLPAEFLQHIGMIRRNLELEARLVDDLLDLTRIRRQKICLHFEVVDVHQMLRNAMEMVQNVIDAKSIDAAVALRHAPRHSVWGDPDRLQQVFMNLFSNAAKFTPAKGLISVRTTNVGIDRLRIEVRDNGIGIEPDMFLRLFNAFEQTERTRRFGGLGLGLSIAKSLVELHSGTITAKSDGPNRGAVFVVELTTVAPVISPPPKISQMTSAKGCRILFVEDHADTRRVMERLLQTIGCDVVSAGGVQEALTLAEKLQFDLLVTDLGLPDGSGTQIMEKCRLGKKIRGIAISGLGQEEDLRRSREAGFEMHLVKPINFATLKEAILRMSA